MINNLDFLTLINVEHPKCKIGDKIKIRYICDDWIDVDRHLKLQTLYGVIVGMIPDYECGKWKYFIMFEDAIYDYESGHYDNQFELV